MIKPFVFACRRVGAGAFVAAIALFVFATIAVTATGSRAAPERIDACKAYAVYAEAGSGDSGLAKGMQRVCAAVGSVPLTQACMTYHTRVSDPDFPPDDDLKLKLAVDCENSMPGGTVISATDTSHGGAVSPPIEVSTSGWDTNLACGTGLECWPEPNDPAPVPSGEIDVVTAGDQAAPDDADIQVRQCLRPNAVTVLSAVLSAGPRRTASRQRMRPCRTKPPRRRRPPPPRTCPLVPRYAIPIPVATTPNKAQRRRARQRHLRGSFCPIRQWQRRSLQPCRNPM